MGFMDSMKDIAGKLGESVEKGAKTVSESSKKLAEKSKIKREISRLEREINDSYVEIGKKYFDEISDSPSEEYSDQIESIKTKTARADKFRQLLMSLEEKQNCPNCGEQIYRTQNYCDKCGAKIDPIETPDIEGYNSPDVTCSNCGEPALSDQVYCENCGAKLDQE